MGVSECPTFIPNSTSSEQIFLECKRGFERNVEWFVERNEFSPENVIAIYNASFDQFKEAVSQIAAKSNENDLVYVSLSGHGDGPREIGEEVVEIITPELSSLNKTEYYPNGKIKRIWEVISGPPINPGKHGIEITQYYPDGKLDKIFIESIPEVRKIRIVPEKVDIERYMVFSDARYVTYKEIGQILNQIKCKKMLVVWSSCGGNIASNILVEGAVYPRVVIGPTCLIPHCKNETVHVSTSWYLASGDWENPLNDSPYAHLEYLSVKDFWQYHFENYPEELIKQETEKANQSLREGKLLSILPDMPFLKDQTVKMADPYNITEDFYFSDTKIKDLLKPHL